MGWDRERSIPNWAVTLEVIQECLENTLLGIEMAQREGTRIDVIALTALEEIDQTLSSLKRDLGA